MSGSLRFRKEERLSGRSTIEKLFGSGRSFSAFPLKVIFNSSPDPAPHQVLVSVPSRAFRKAVDRNKLKRRIREGYRLNKSLLPASPAYRLAYIYIAREILPSQTIHQAIRTSMQRLLRNEKTD